MASSSTLNRVELTPADASVNERYKKVVYHPEKMEQVFVDVFLDAYTQVPKEVILDFDATDDPIHGNQEGRFFHGYYDCYCYLPLYVTCDDHLLVAQLREANQDASAGSVEVLEMLVCRIRERWSDVRIIMRADSGFCRDAIMTWCEANQVHYVLDDIFPVNSCFSQLFNDDVSISECSMPTYSYGMDFLTIIDLIRFVAQDYSTELLQKAFSTFPAFFYNGYLDNGIHALSTYDNGCFVIAEFPFGEKKSRYFKQQQGYKFYRPFR